MLKQLGLFVKLVKLNLTSRNRESVCQVGLYIFNNVESPLGAILFKVAKSKVFLFGTTFTVGFFVALESYFVVTVGTREVE